MFDKKTRMPWMLVAFATIVFLAPVTAGPASALPPEDGLVAYTSDEGGRVSIWTIEANGTNAIDLTGAYGEDAFRPVWSPDGSRIAFAREDIFVVPVIGTPPVNTTDNADAQNIQAWNISWSPDGSKFAYPSGGRLYTVGLWGRTVVEIAIGASEGRTPRWSPDGARIAYTHQTSNVTWDTRVVHLGSGVITDLTDGGGTSTNDEATWSPDGSRIAFRSTRSGFSAVWVMNADGSSQSELIAAVGGSSRQSMSPTWSPDGSWIADVSDGDVWIIGGTGPTP